MVRVSRIKNGKYDPGIIMSFSKSGSINRMTAPSAPHSITKLKIFGIHFIV